MYHLLSVLLQHLTRHFLHTVVPYMVNWSLLPSFALPVWPHAVQDDVRGFTVLSTATCSIESSISPSATSAVLPVTTLIAEPTFWPTVCLISAAENKPEMCYNERCKVLAFIPLNSWFGAGWFSNVKWAPHLMQKRQSFGTFSPHSLQITNVSSVSMFDSVATDYLRTYYILQQKTLTMPIV